MDEITPWQFAFLQACERPISLYLAVQRAARASDKETAQVLAEVAVWLPVATHFGYLRQVA